MAERIFRGFLVLGRRIFSRISSPDSFSSFLCEKVARKILQQNLQQNPPKFRVAPVRFGSGIRFGDGTVRVVPVFGSGGSSTEGVFVCFSTVSQRGRFRFRFLENGSGGSGSTFGSCKNGSDGSGFRFRFGSWATLKICTTKIPDTFLQRGRAKTSLVSGNSFRNRVASA